MNAHTFMHSSTHFLSFRRTSPRVLAVVWLGLSAVLSAVLGLSQPASAATVVKMATLAPEGSVWDKVLKEMGADWQQQTQGEVTLRIYPGGVAGDEPDLVRKMLIGQLQAAALSTAGLSVIDNGFQIFQLPMFYRSYDELFYVLDKMRPQLEARLLERGFVMLNWGHGGWVHFFSKQPVRGVGDLRKQKIFSWSGNDAMIQIWRKNGFQPVALAATDILTGLQTGMIEALPTTPLAALSLQWFRQTPYMQSLGLAPLVGATVITKKAWDQLSPNAQQVLRATGKKSEARFNREIPDQDERAIAQMKERGLNVVTISAAEEAEWQKAAENFAGSMHEFMESVDLLDTARKERDAFRAAAGAAAHPPAKAGER